MKTSPVDIDRIRKLTSCAGLVPEDVQELVVLGYRAAAELERLRVEIEGEREARGKLDHALQAKDRAMGILFDRLTRAGVDCSDLIP